jgi:glycosyltransferase involved in cell wall biosynthesis
MFDNKENPLVTIAVVTYNSDKYVESAIRSILSSSYEHFELIISDDASTDNTWKIIQSFNDSRIKAFQNEKNIGEYPNRNKCITKASGKYLLFIDGDDLLIDVALSYAVSAMEQNSDCSLACGYLSRNYMLYPFKLTPKQSYRFNYFGDSFFSNSLCQTFFRTQTLKDVGLLPEKYISGDYFIKSKIAASSNILIIYPLLGWWRQTPNQASSQLKNRDISLFEKFNMDKEILNSSDFPLSNNEKLLILYKLKMILLRHLIKKVIRLNFKNFLRFLNSYLSINEDKPKLIHIPKYTLDGSPTNVLVQSSTFDSYDSFFKND